MTRLLKTLLIIIISVKCYGQKEKLTFGINSGINISFFDDSYLQTNTFLGYSIGVKTRLNLHNSWGMKNMNEAAWYFESGINYLYHGYSYTIGKQELGLTQRQVEIPLYLIGRVSKKRLPRQMTKKKISLVGKFGSVISIQRQYNSSRTFSIGNEMINEQIVQKAFNLYLAGGLGFEREMDKIIIGTGITIHSGLISSTKGILNNKTQGQYWNYTFRGNYLSVDIFIIIKDLENFKRQKKALTDPCAVPRY